MNLVRLESLLSLALIAVGCKAAFRTWGNAGSILAIVFFVSLGLEQLLIPDVPFGPLGASAIVGGALAVVAGSGLARRKSAEPVDTVIEVLPRRTRACNVAVWTVTAIAVWYTWTAYQAVVVQQTNYVNGIFYREAFGVGLGGGIEYRAAQAIMYVGAVLIAIDVMARGLRRPAPLIFISSAAAQSYILSTKSSMLITLTLFATVWISARQGSVRRIGRARNLAVLLVVVVAAVGIVSAVTQRRAGGGADVSQTIAYAFGGPPSALSQVLDGGFDPNQTGEAATVAGLRELVGGRSRGTGAGLIPVQLAPNSYESSINVYTWYLALLADLGAAGMAIVLAAMGWWATVLSQRAARGVVRVPGLVVLALVFSLLLWAPIFSLTYFNFWFLILALAPTFGLLYRVAVAPSPRVLGGAALAWAPAPGAERALPARVVRTPGFRTRP
ncbi:MAG: hypothetical protein ACT452_08450 [Microthrixaceae bacterium]